MGIYWMVIWPKTEGAKTSKKVRGSTPVHRPPHVDGRGKQVSTKKPDDYLLVEPAIEELNEVTLVLRGEVVVDMEDLDVIRTADGFIAVPRSAIIRMNELIE